MFMCVFLGPLLQGRVPKSGRYSWASMALEQMAQGGCIANVVLGAQIGWAQSLRN